MEQEKKKRNCRNSWFACQWVSQEVSFLVPFTRRRRNFSSDYWEFSLRYLNTKPTNLQATVLFKRQFCLSNFRLLRFYCIRKTVAQVSCHHGGCHNSWQFSILGLACNMASVAPDTKSTKRGKHFISRLSCVMLLQNSWHIFQELYIYINKTALNGFLTTF